MMTREVIEAGSVLALSATAGQGASSLIQLMPFALVLAIFYFVVLLPMRRRQKKVETFLSAVRRDHESERAVGAAPGGAERPARSGTQRRRRLPGPGAGRRIGERVK
jgi:hypothetical protein